MATRVNGRDPKVEEHLRISRQFLCQAQEEFAQGDKLQASEKAWGAAAHAVKPWLSNEVGSTMGIGTSSKP